MVAVHLLARSSEILFKGISLGILGKAVPPKKADKTPFFSTGLRKDTSVCLAASYSFCWFPHFSSEVKSSLSL